MKRKVAILMSTYNGDEYVEKQIESIFKQTYKNFDLYVRDDGSKSEFVEYLEKLQSHYGFHLIKGVNVGFLKSFMSLLKEVDGYDYYSFADQDDIWFPEKLEKSIEWLSKNDQAIPLLYHCAYYTGVDINNKDKLYYYSDDGYNFRKCFTTNYYSGFAMVINNKTRELMLKGDTDRITYHDWWAGMIAVGFGKYHFDNMPLAYHIDHKTNVTAFTSKKRIQWFFQTLREESEIHKRAVEYKRCFYNDLSKKNRKLLNLFATEHYSLIVALKKTFYPKKWRDLLSSDLVMRLLMVIGKI